MNPSPRFSPRRLRRFAATLALACTGCSSVAWNPPTSTAVWRGAPLRETDIAGVVATDEGGAGEAHERYATVARAIAAAGLEAPARPLLVVVGADDPLLCGDADATRAAMLKWHPDLVAQGFLTTEAGEKDTAAERELLANFALRSMAVRAPLDAPELALPAEWQRQFDWLLVLPSDSCIATMFDRFLDHGLESAGFGTRLLMAPLMPLVRSKGCAALEQRVSTAILTAAFAGKTGLDRGAVEACIADLGLADPHGRPIDVGRE